MGLYNEAVKEALANNSIEIAEEYANKPESEENKKKLWLEIVKHLFQHNKKIKDIIELTNNNQVLKIQDILPHFNGNYNINDFKDQLCKSLDEYDTAIEILESDMKGYSYNVES